mmetsp:Transcript_27295/g.80291  ORF Transcript_27295/g.80291 Transcript_27295/m.80291 type:complete len:321 (-) Transcript_27295:38-1000(-)
MAALELAMLWGAMGIAWTPGAPQAMSRRVLLHTPLFGALASPEVAGALQPASPCYPVSERLALPMQTGARLRLPPLTPARVQQLRYPDWLRGTWEVRATFSRFTAPLGPSFVRGEELEEAVKSARGDQDVKYVMRFVDSPEGVRQDKAYNAIAEVRAFGGDSPEARLTSAVYSANTLELIFKSPAASENLGLGSEETRLVLRSVASATEADGAGRWLTSEVFEQTVYDGVGHVIERPQLLETIISFSPPAGPIGSASRGATRLTAMNRICKYAQPGTLGERLSGGCAVSAFDYDWQLTQCATASDFTDDRSWDSAFGLCA